MLEMGNFGDWETSAAASAGRRRQTAAPATTRAAWTAAGGWWFRHRDIVILKQGVARLVAIQAAPNGADVTIQDAPPAVSGRSIRCFSLAIFLRRPSRADRSGEPSDGPTTRPDVIRASRGPSYDSPGKSLTQPTSESTVRTQSEFVTRLK